jgi:hypothetical protein
MRRRPPNLIDLSQDDRIALQYLLHDGHTEQRVARRARVLLAMTNPKTVVRQLADQVLLTRAAIWALCRRYEQIGIEAVFDAPRSGRPWEFSPLAAGRD